MTLLELVANCVAFVVEGEDSINNLTVMTFKESANYRSFINNALPEINRAIQEITSYKKFQLKMYQKDISTIDYNNAHMIIELPKEIRKEIYEIYKVELIDSNGTITLLEHRLEGNTIRTVNFKRSGTLMIRYYPRIKILTAADYDYYTDLEQDDKSIDLYDLGLDDIICNSVIPYLVKSKLWQEIEPELAQLCKNEGLQNLALLHDGNNDEPYQTSVFLIQRW